MTYRAAWRPDFVIAGITHDDGRVTVFGCRSIVHAEARVTSEPVEVPGFGIYREYLPGVPDVRLEVNATDFTTANGEDFNAAMAALLARWAPEPAPEVDPFGRPQLDGGW